MYQISWYFKLISNTWETSLTITFNHFNVLRFVLDVLDILDRILSKKGKNRIVLFVNMRRTRKSGEREGKRECLRAPLWSGRLPGRESILASLTDRLSSGDRTCTAYGCNRIGRIESERVDRVDRIRVALVGKTRSQRSNRVERLKLERRARSYCRRAINRD